VDDADRSDPPDQPGTIPAAAAWTRSPEASIFLDKIQADEFPASEGEIIFISRLLDLLFLFLGEALTLSLLRITWPGAIFEGFSSENGRKE
jgi:hypothetical protein